MDVERLDSVALDVDGHGQVFIDTNVYVPYRSGQNFDMDGHGHGHGRSGQSSPGYGRIANVDKCPSIRTDMVKYPWTWTRT